MFGYVQKLQIAHLIPLNIINIVSYNKFYKPRLGRFLGLTLSAVNWIYRTVCIVHIALRALYV